MLSHFRQMTEECEKRENLSLHRKEDIREVVLACNVPITSREILVFAVDLSFRYTHVTNTILSFFLVNIS
jgi:hypothetical protein